MEPINAVALADPDVFPDERALGEVLGRSLSAYTKLIALYERYGLTHEWRYYRDGKAWLCKVRKKTKTIAWMSAWPGYMKATVYIHERHVAGIYELPIPDAEKLRIRDTKNVGRSKPCSFEIRNQRILPVVEQLVRYKMSLP